MVCRKLAPRTYDIFICRFHNRPPMPKKIQTPMVPRCIVRRNNIILLFCRHNVIYRPFISLSGDLLRHENIVHKNSSSSFNPPSLTQHIPATMASSPMIIKRSSRSLHCIWNASQRSVSGLARTSSDCYLGACRTTMSAVVKTDVQSVGGFERMMTPSLLTQHQLSPSRLYSSSSHALKKAWDPSLDEYKYWNREESKKGVVSCRIFDVDANIKISILSNQLSPLACR